MGDTISQNHILLVYQISYFDKTFVVTTNLSDNHKFSFISVNTSVIVILLDLFHDVLQQ